MTHEASDGMWQLIGASDADPRTGRIGHLDHAIDEDRTLIDILDLPPGRTAQRTAPGRALDDEARPLSSTAAAAFRRRGAS